MNLKYAPYAPFKHVQSEAQGRPPKQQEVHPVSEQEEFAIGSEDTLEWDASVSCRSFKWQQVQRPQATQKHQSSFGVHYGLAVGR